MRRVVLLLLTMQCAAPAAVREIVTRLRLAPRPEFATSISPAIADDLSALKHSLRDVISHVVNAPTGTSPEELQARVLARLENEDVPVGDEGEYGVITAIKIARPAEYPGWLIASISLAIPYGDDTSLYVFHIRNGVWRLAMSIEAGKYDEISGAQGWLEYRVGRTLVGTPFLTTVDHSPWPTSNWQSLRLQVFQVASRPDRPLRLVERTFSYFIDEPAQISINPGRFGLIFRGGLKGEMAAVFSYYYLEYRVAAGASTVIKETSVDTSALTVRWARTDWQQASSTLDPSGISETREWHRRLQKWRFGCTGYPQPGLQTVAGREELIVTAECSESLGGPAGYAVLRAGPQQGFRVASVSSSPPEWLHVYAQNPCIPALRVRATQSPNKPSNRTCRRVSRQAWSTYASSSRNLARCAPSKSSIGPAAPVWLSRPSKPFDNGNSNRAPEMAVWRRTNKPSRSSLRGNHDEESLRTARDHRPLASLFRRPPSYRLALRSLRLHCNAAHAA
jgi:hypothetical protein